MNDDTLRIGTFITQYPYGDESGGQGGYFCSGAEYVAEKISQELVAKGHEVHVFTSAAGFSSERTQTNGVVVHRSPSITTVNTTQIAPTIIIDHITTDFDIIHAHNSTPPGTIAAFLHSVITRTPMVITHHGGEQYERHGGLFRSLGLYLYMSAFIEPIFSHADCVVSPSDGYAIESEVLSSESVHVETIPNGVDMEEMSTTKSTEDAKSEIGLQTENFTILFLGSHHRRKGIDILVQAFAELSESTDDITLILAGSGEETPALKREVEKLGIDEDVVFPGYVPESEKPTYMKAADVFVLPSRTPGAEVFPLVLLESAAAGTPVIASDFPSIRSIVDEHDFGLLVEPNNASALSGALSTLINSSQLKSYQQNALLMAESHQWSSIADQYESLYKRLIE